MNEARINEGGRYHVRALDRSLAILKALNQHNGLQATELSRLVHLPRPTVLRLLNTLSEAGYVIRSQSDGLYRATRRLRDLSCGYEEQTWLSNVVRPFLAELEEELIWPLAVVRLQDNALIVEALTDHRSQMLERRDSAGMELSPLHSTSGYLHMALLSEPKAKAYIEHVLANHQATMAELGMSRQDLLDKVAETRAAGFAHLHRPTYSAIGVPVRCGENLRFVLNLRMHGSMEAREKIISRYVAPLHEAGEVLAARIMQTGSMIYDVPQNANAYC